MEKMQVNATEITDPILATAHIFLRKEEFLGLFLFLYEIKDTQEWPGVIMMNY